MRACCLMMAMMLSLWPILALGQQNPPAEAAAPKAGPAVEASQLDTYMLRDSKGNLVPVLGLPFEEFEQLLRAKKGLNAASMPSYTIEALSLAGIVQEQIADLSLTATIRVREAGWVKVPLNLGSTVLREPAKYEGPGEHFLAFDDAAGGYVCWLKSEGAAAPHVLRLQIAAAIQETGGAELLSLAVPRATESSLRLAIHEKNIEASLAKGEGLVSVRASGSEDSHITVLGPAGDLQLTWRTQPGGAIESAPLLETAGDITVRIQSERRITSEARLRVRSNGAPLEWFRVRLPAGMELIPTPGLAAYSVKSQENATDIVEVRLERPAAGVSEITLRVQRTADGDTAASLRPAQFEVLGAVRQRGTIDFVLDGEWQMDFTEDVSVHRLEPSADTPANVVARYEYFRQPCSLEVKVSARPSRVTVEPSHAVFVEADRVRVETTLKYRFRGARAWGVAYKMGDWTFDRLTPDALLDIPQIEDADASELRVPFRTDGPLVTELELKLEAHRTLPPGSERLSLVLPQPVADFVAPATIVISAADNIELIPRATDMVGLSADAVTVPVPGRQQPGIVFRDLGGGEPAMFVAGVRKLSRVTSTSAVARVRMDRSQMHVEQRLEYRIAHEPQRSFELLVPRPVAATGWQVRHGDESLTPTPLGEENPEEGPSHWQVTMPSDQIGNFEIVVSYSLPIEWDRKAALPLAIPHVLPAEDDNQFTGQQVEFVLSGGATIEPDLEGVDELAVPIAAGAGTSHTYAWSSAVNVSHWTLELGEQAEPSAVSVSQLWVQSWITPQIRQDRVAMRISTNQEAVRIRLPKRVRQSSVQTAVNGHEVEGSFRVPGLLVVAVPPSAQGRECVLEVCFSIDPPELQIGLMKDDLQTAQVEQATGPRRFYWQLALPDDLHLVVAPRDMAAEMAWSSSQATGWLKSRRPVMDQRQLEAWIKASRQEALPQAVNEYLFGGLGQWPTMHFAAGHRTLIVSLASSGILVLGLLLMHMPVLRNPGVLLFAAILLAGLALAAPDAALLGAQSAVFGVAVMIVAAAWRWMSSGQAVSIPAGGNVTTARREGSSLQSAPRQRDRSSRITSTAGAGPLMEARP